MKIPKDIAERVVTGSIHEIWDTFINLEDEYKEYEEDYDAVRFGIKVMFEIQDLWEKTNQIIRKDKEKRVIIDGESYSLSDFRTEKELRRKIMIKEILNNMLDVSPTEAR